MKPFFLVLSCSLFIGMVSCNNEKEVQSTEAVLRFTGLVAADGCGYFLDIDGKEYKPSNEEVIPESYQEQDVSRVQLSYEILEEPKEFSCGMLPSHYNSTIKIIDIKKL